jgi:integrase
MQGCAPVRSRSADADTLPPAIDSTARIGESVVRRRFQRGTVYQNRTNTQWLGAFCSYVLDSNGAEKRVRKQLVLCPVKSNGKITGKREAQRLLQPYVDRVNVSIASPQREHKSSTFEAFAEIWERDYLSLSKASTQSGMRSNLKRLKAAFGQKELRAIDAGTLQRFIASSMAEGLGPKSVRNLWGTISLIWSAALAQKYVDSLLPKPKLPRRPKTMARFFSLNDVARIIAASEGERHVFYWLMAETGLRAGEIAGLKLTDIDGAHLTVNRSVWNGKEQSPKTNSAIRTLALSPQLVHLLTQQITRQKESKRTYLFSSTAGTPLDMNVYRQRKMTAHLKSLEIPRAGFHAFRHFNVALLDALRVPLKTIQERLGHALTGSFTLDVYGGRPEWKRNLEAAKLVGAELQNAVRKLESGEDMRIIAA